jgi:hypothetical protein
MRRSKLRADFTPGMNPNSEHQLWSHWVFTVEADRRFPTLGECREAGATFFRRWTGVARMRVYRKTVTQYIFELQGEGLPAPDPGYRTFLKRRFIEDVMFRGFGYSSRLVGLEVKILAGNAENGLPPEQLLAIPSFTTLWKGLRPDGECAL